MTTGRLDGLELALVAVTMSLDTFAVAIALGAQGLVGRRWRVVGAFAAFAFAFPVVGVLVGRRVAGWMEVGAEWLGVATLAGLGAWTLWSALRGEALDVRGARRAAQGGGLLALATVVSLDNLAIGFGVGVHGAHPLVLGAAAGIATLLATLAGLGLGRSGRRALGRPATAAAGVLLLVVAVMLERGWI